MKYTEEEAMDFILRGQTMGVHACQRILVEHLLENGMCKIYKTNDIIQLIQSLDKKTFEDLLIDRIETTLDIDKEIF